jgi:hypothetical protein
MKRRAILTISIVILLLGSISVQAAPVQERGPSTAEERARAVKVSHDLEQDPLAKDAEDQRDWVLDWIEKIPDITVNVCYDFFGKYPNPPRGHSLEIMVQMTISSTAYISSIRTRSRMNRRWRLRACLDRSRHTRRFSSKTRQRAGHILTS